MASTKTPNADATLRRTSRGTWFFVNASFVSAQRITGAAPALATASSVIVRRRSGTYQIQSRVPIRAAAIAPRE